MRSAAVVTVGISLLAATAVGAGQQVTATNDLEVRVGPTTFMGEVRLGKVNQGSTADPRQVLAANTLTIQRGSSLGFSVHLITGSTSVDVTRDPKLQVDALASDCFQISAGSINALPRPSCSERIDAVGASISTFGIAYVDDANKMYGYDIFAVKVTK